MAKAKAPTKGKAAKKGKKLSEGDLKQVSGGALNAYLTAGSKGAKGGKNEPEH
jgi:hypothetical protein